MFEHHPEMARRWAAETPSFAALPARVGKRHGGLASLADDEVVHAGIGGLINDLIRPAQRLFARPSFATEAASDASGPLSAAESRARFALARSNAKAMGHPEADLPVEEGQGVWLDEHGLHENPLYMQSLPARGGRMDRYNDALDYAADVGRMLDQHAVPLARAIPGVVDTPEGANAIIARDLPRGALSTLGRQLGKDNVIAQQPGNRALVFPMKPSGDITQAEIEALRQSLENAVPGIKARYGVSNSGQDRLTVGDSPLPEGWNEVGYGAYGPNPRTPAYSALEKKLLKQPLISQDLSGPFPMGGLGLSY